jgi:hypothetical protein
VKYELLIKPNEDSCWHWPAASDNRSSWKTPVRVWSSFFFKMAWRNIFLSVVHRLAVLFVYFVWPFWVDRVDARVRLVNSSAIQFKCSTTRTYQSSMECTSTLITGPEYSTLRSKSSLQTSLGPSLGSRFQYRSRSWNAEVFPSYLHFPC